MEKRCKANPSIPEWWRKMLKIMRLCMFLTFIGIMQVSAMTYSQNVKLDLKVKNASLESVMTAIRAQSEFSFFFDDAAVKQISNITLDLKDSSIEEVMKNCLKGTDFSFRVMDKTIILFKENRTVNDPKKLYVIKGKVVDERGLPMPGVNVVLDSTRVGMATDTAGRFTLPLPKRKGKLVFSFLGYKTQVVNYEEGKDLLVRMREDMAGLDEVQVVAYGSRKKREMVTAVSSIKGKEIQEMPTHSLENMLQGRMAGVEINNISGSPGGGGTVVAIRGYNSLFVEGEGGSRQYGEPLYVVDGVPIHSFTSPVTGSNTLSDLDPSMIESIEVLKDAASAAIYGSRAGNGVILITTKKGRSGKANFTANMSYSASWLPRTPAQTGGHMERMYYLNALRNTRNVYLGSDGEYKFATSYQDVMTKDWAVYDYFFQKKESLRSQILQDSLNPFFNNSTNWYKQTYRTAKILNGNVQISGGNEGMQYIVGLGYYNEQGIVLNTGFRRTTLNANLTTSPTKRMRVDLRSTFAYSDRSRGGNSGPASKIEGVGVDPTTESTLRPNDSWLTSEVLQTLNEGEEKNQGYTVRLNMNVNYQIMKGLDLTVSGAMDFNQQNQNTFKPSTMDKDLKLSMSDGTIARDIMMLNENLLHYNETFWQDHNIDLLFGLSFQKDQAFSNGGSGKGGPSDLIHYVDNSWGNNGLISAGDVIMASQRYTSSKEEETMVSYFGRLAYNFKKKYLLDATIRRDGSSVFGEDVRWATFPSVAAGWAFTEEPFMKPLYWLNFGKIRVSWGTSGNKFGQRYLAHGLMSPNGSFHGTSGMAPANTGGMINRKLTWEKVNQYDFGLDMDLLDYRVHVKLDYYYRYTKAQLNRVDLPGDTYYHTMQWRNAMETSNEGLEIETEFNILRETAVKWRLKVNASRNWNRFEKSADGFDYKENVIGKPLYQIPVWKTDGYYNNLNEVPTYYLANDTKHMLYEKSTSRPFLPGTQKIVDMNGDGKITNADKYYASSPLPVAYGGIVSELRWKDFDLTMLFSYSIGRHILKIYDNFKLNPSLSSGALLIDINKVNSWKQPGDNADYPYLQDYDNMSIPFNGYFDNDIETVHMLRLKQLTLGYNLNESFAKKAGVRGARLFVTAENLFLLTNYSGIDPEIVSIYDGIDNLRSYPLPSKFTVGLTVNF